MEDVLGGAAVAVFIAFLGALRATLRAREGEAGALSAVATIAGSVVAAAALVDLALDDESVRALLAFPTVALLAAAAAAIFATGALPRLVGYVAVAAAVLQLPAGLSLDDRGLAIGALAAWVVLASGAMLRPRGD